MNDMDFDSDSDKSYAKPQDEQELVQIIPKYNKVSSHSFDKQIISQQYFDSLFVQSFQKQHRKTNGKQMSESYSSMTVEDLVKQKHQQLFQHELKNKILQNNFILLQNQQQQSFNRIQLKLVSEIQNGQIVEIFIQLEKYAKRYTILQSSEESCRHHYENVGFGSFGSVYASNLSGSEKFAIKCLKFKENDIEELKNHIREFFIADLMSATGIGPRILRKNGFDFIVFPTCLEFDMEMGSSVELSTLEEDLKQNLLKMHALNVVHSDIKPSNVIYSNLQKKNIFLDFGIAQILNCEKWEDTITNFKGTYEFCGKKMRQLFGKKKLGYINLFINDKQMLVNTINSFKKANKQRRICNQQIMLSQKNLANEKIFLIKYLIYKGQNGNILSENIDIILKILNQIRKDQLKRKIIRQIENLSFSLQQKTRKQLIQKILWRIGQINFLTVKIQLIGLYNKKYSNFIQKLIGHIERNSSIKQPQIIEKIKINKFHENEYSNKNLKANMLYILSHHQQIIKFEQQQYFQMILAFISFWKSKFRVSIQQKQFVSKIAKQRLQSSQNFNIQNFKYLQSRYLPEQPFVKENCQNIIFIYGYLLSYCMKGQFTSFKVQNIMTIAKDCIFLSFKYYLFVKQCLVRYFTFLIQTNFQALVTEAVVRFGEFVYLTKNHLLIQNKAIVLQQQKSLHLSYQYFIQEFSKSFVIGNENQNLHVNFQLLKGLKKVFTRPHLKQCIYQQILQRPGQTEQYIEKLVQKIHYQFTSTNNNLKILEIFERALQIIYFSQYCPNKNIRILINSPFLKNIDTFQLNRQEFNILSLIHLQSSINTKRQKISVNYTNEKINCSEISFYFNLKTKTLLYIKQKNIVQFEKIFKILLSLTFQTTLMNVSIFFTIQKFIDFGEINALKLDWSDHLQRKMKISLQLMEHFCQRIQDFDDQIQYCIDLLQFKQFPLEQKPLQIMKKIRNKFRPRYLSVLRASFQRNYQYKKINIITYMIALQILNNLHYKSLQYFKFRLMFFKLVFEQFSSFLNSVQRMKNEITQKNNQNIQTKSIAQIKQYNYLKNIYIFSEFFHAHQLLSQKQNLKYLKIRKIKYFLYKQHRQQRIINQLSAKMFKINLVSQIAQMFVQYCIQIQKYHDTDELMRFFTAFVNFRNNQIGKKSQTEMVESFLHLIFRIQSFHLNKINIVSLFPLYVLLPIYMTFFCQHFTIWRQLLIKTYKLFPKYTAFNRQQRGKANKFSVKDFSNQIMLYFTVNYIERLKKNRKYYIWIRLLIKSLNVVTSFGRHSIKEYLNLLIKKLGIISPINKKYEKINYLYQNKVRAIITNFYRTYSNQETRKKHLEQDFKTMSRIMFQGWTDEKEQWTNQFKNQPSPPQINQYCFQQIIQQTFQARSKLLDLQYKVITQQLWRQKKKRPQEISWIRQLNS